MESALYEQLLNCLITHTHTPTFAQPWQRQSFFKLLAHCSLALHNDTQVVLYKGKLIVTETQKQEVLLKCHADAMNGAHLGRDKTYDKMKDRFWWKGMHRDVGAFTANCPQCLRVNPNVRTMEPPLKPIKVVAPWHHIQIDCIGPLPRTGRGNCMIVAISDLFSNWPVCKATPDKTAATVVEFLYETACTYGMWKVIQSDQGSEFVNELLKGFNNRLGALCKISSAYHPQSQGKVEKQNGTLKTMLSKLVNDSATDWDLLLPPVLLAYRSSKQSSSKLSPYEIMFGRKCTLPMDVEHVDPDVILSPSATPVKQQIIDRLSEERKLIHQKVVENMEKAQQRQVKKYAKRKLIDEHISETLPIGSQVMLKDGSTQASSLGQTTYSGPYVVTEIKGDSSVILKHKITNGVKHKPQAVNRLKKLKCSPSQ